MFHGSIPSALQSVIYKQVKYWKCSDIFIGCSGNFTIERSITNKKFALHGNDVQIYSVTFGKYLAGMPLNISFNPDYELQFGWLCEYMNTPEDTIATMFLCTQMLQGLGKVNEYYRRIESGYRE